MKTCFMGFLRKETLFFFVDGFGRKIWVPSPPLPPLPPLLHKQGHD